MIRETWVQSQVVSYQRLLKWYLIPPCLTLSNRRWTYRGYGGAIRGKKERPPLHLSVVAIEKGAFWSPSSCGHQLYFYYHYLLRIVINYLKPKRSGALPYTYWKGEPSGHPRQRLPIYRGIEIPREKFDHEFFFKNRTNKTSHSFWN